MIHCYFFLCALSCSLVFVPLCLRVSSLPTSRQRLSSSPLRLHSPGTGRSARSLPQIHRCAPREPRGPRRPHPLRCQSWQCRSETAERSSRQSRKARIPRLPAVTATLPPTHNGLPVRRFIPARGRRPRRPLSRQRASAVWRGAGAIVGLNRSTCYYQPAGESAYN